MFTSPFLLFVFSALAVHITIHHLFLPIRCKSHLMFVVLSFSHFQDVLMSFSRVTHASLLKRRVLVKRSSQLFTLPSCFVCFQSCVLAERQTSWQTAGVSFSCLMSFARKCRQFNLSEIVEHCCTS